jgi:hypothetical protein
MPNFMPGPTQMVFEIDPTNPNVRRAIVTSTAVHVQFETRGPVPLPATLSHIVNNTPLSPKTTEEIHKLYTLYVESRRASQAIHAVRDRVPVNFQQMAYEAIGKTMISRDGSVIQARSYNYITNLSCNAMDKLLSRIVPLFRTTNGFQDVVVRCTELDNVLVAFGVKLTSKWGVYLSDHQSSRHQLRFRAGMPLRRLEAAVREHVVLKHSAWAYHYQLSHTVPTNPLSAPVFGGPLGGACPFPAGPT